MADSGGMLPKDTPPMWDRTDDIECLIPVDPEKSASRWVEPDAGGCYIPLPPGRESRNLEIWSEAARRLGVSDA